MKRGIDPAILFETLADIKDQYDGVENIYELEINIIFLDVGTDEYLAVLTAEQCSKDENSA
jgi:hypothetical protein